MSLPNVGSSISLNQVNVELGRTGTQSINMNETAVRTLFGKASGVISMYDGYGKSNIPTPASITATYVGAYSARISWTGSSTYNSYVFIGSSSTPDTQYTVTAGSTGTVYADIGHTDDGNRFTPSSSKDITVKFGSSSSGPFGAAATVTVTTTSVVNAPTITGTSGSTKTYYFGDYAFHLYWDYGTFRWNGSPGNSSYPMGIMLQQEGNYGTSGDNGGYSSTCSGGSGGAPGRYQFLAPNGYDSSIGIYGTIGSMSPYTNYDYYCTPSQYAKATFPYGYPGTPYDSYGKFNTYSHGNNWDTTGGSGGVGGGSAASTGGNPHADITDSTNPVRTFFPYYNTGSAATYPPSLFANRSNAINIASAFGGGGGGNGESSQPGYPGPFGGGTGASGGAANGTGGRGGNGGGSDGSDGETPPSAATWPYNGGGRGYGGGGGGGGGYDYYNDIGGQGGNSGTQSSGYVCVCYQYCN